MLRKHMEDLATRFYFSRYRNIGTGRHMVFAAIMLLLVMRAVIGGLLDPYPKVIEWLAQPSGIALVAAVVAIPIVYFGMRYLWGYKDTNMILRADGASRWSIHTGVLVSFIPQCFAVAPDNFIDGGAAKILKGCIAIGLRGSVKLESHLLGNSKRRRARAADLASNLPGCVVRNMGVTGELGPFYAWTLTRLRNARRQHKELPPRPPFRRDAPVGAIEIDF